MKRVYWIESKNSFDAKIYWTGRSWIYNHPERRLEFINKEKIERIAKNIDGVVCCGEKEETMNKEQKRVYWIESKETNLQPYWAGLCWAADPGYRKEDTNREQLEKTAKRINGVVCWEGKGEEMNKKKKEQYQCWVQKRHADTVYYWSGNKWCWSTEVMNTKYWPGNEREEAQEIADRHEGTLCWCGVEDE